VVGVVELLEAAGLLVAAIAFVVPGPGRYPLTTYGVAGTFVLAAALLVLVAVGTLRGRPWARTSGMVWQALEAIIGLSVLNGGSPLTAAVIAVPAVVALVLLLTRPVREALARPS
jgi:hypothetical protein